MICNKFCLSKNLVPASIRTHGEYTPRRSLSILSSAPSRRQQQQQQQQQPQPPLSLSNNGFFPSLDAIGFGIALGQSNRGFSFSAVAAKGFKQPVTDMRDTDIEIDPDEIEFVGRKLRRFQRETTGVADPLPSEVEPSPLHLVTLTRSYGGNIWWIKKILWEFGMYSRPTRFEKWKQKYPCYQKAIVPNTPENNLKLAKVKHLVRIDRVTFPYGYPETEADLKHMRISENGEVTFVKEVESHLLDDGTVATTPLGVPRPSIPEEMDEKTLEIDCFRKLVNREFLDEYHEEYDNRHLGQGHFKGMKVYWDKNKPPIVY